MAWNKCQECGGDLEELGEPYTTAKCVKCGAMHGWDDDDGWFSFGAEDKDEPTTR